MYMALKCVNSIPTGKEFCFEIFCEMLYFHQNINMWYFDLVFVVFFKTCRVYTTVPQFYATILWYKMLELFTNERSHAERY